MHDGRIEEILEVLLSLPDNVPQSRSAAPRPHCKKCGEVLLPPPEVSDGLPESLQGQPVVFLHGLTELLPGPIGLLLQLDSIPYCRCPSPGSRIAAATGTADLTSTIDAENVVHSDSVSPTSTGIWSKLSRRCELNTSLA
ncbi:hypothetical protein ATANTOWER_011261 [Ataeniobius toweri]|uniref:Transposase n=1 Tax=Ataeniobius toweri TaxID=208326 RepID=A0ABU7CGH6_9TELE|nr:hypothetical protein [Ataeniobius toweri]